MEIIIRPAEPRDAESINKIRRMQNVMHNTMAIPSENNSLSHRFTDNVDCKSSHQFTAVLCENGEETVLGMAGITVSQGMRTRHVASMGIMVHEDYQNKGVGTALMQAIVDLADNYIGLFRLELEVYPDNQRAIALYSKFGFEHEGVRRGAAVRGGQYIDCVMMARLNTKQRYCPKD